MNPASDNNQPITREIFEHAATNAGTDKGSCHGYQRFYPLFLSQIDRQDSFTIIEIGYGNGASIPMWRSLFPNSFLVCVDKDVEKKGDGYVVVRGDQGDPEALLAAIPKTGSPVRLIIDDGSHYPEHQLTTLSILVDTILEPGGFYIVEDIETSYWLAGNLYGNEIRCGLFSRWSAIEAFKLAADYINRGFLSPEDKSLLEYSMLMTGLAPTTARAIGSITFGHNCALIRKIEQGDEQYAIRPYGYEAFTKRN